MGPAVGRMALELPVAVGAGAVVALIAASAFFSSSETAIFSLGPDETDPQRPSEEPDARALADLRANPHRLLVTLLVGNNIVNVAISSVITAAFVGRLSPGLAVVGATVVASSVVLVFGEIVPKSYGLTNARRWSLRVARPLQHVERGLYPVVVAFDAVTRRLNALLEAEQPVEEAYLDR